MRADARKVTETRLALAGGRGLVLGRRTLVMGVVNVTPDSFYPGSRTPRVEDAVERALKLIGEGAEIIDIGGESTRPGSTEVPLRDEIARVLPVVEALRKLTSAVLSVDTRRAEVAREAMRAGADIINDVSALTADPEMATVVAETGAVVVLMHMRGTPANMQERASYDDVLLEVKAELGVRVAVATRAGIRADRIWLDPGLGFAKTPQQCLAVMRRLDELQVFERPLLIGASRKNFVGRVLAEPLPEGRLEGSLAVAAVAALKGAAVIRTHDVLATVRVVRVVDAIRSPALEEY